MFIVERRFAHGACTGNGAGPCAMEGSVSSKESGEKEPGALIITLERGTLSTDPRPADWREPRADDELGEIVMQEGGT